MLSRKEVCHLLGISRWTLWRWQTREGAPIADDIDPVELSEWLTRRAKRRVALLLQAATSQP